jgi:hypothetical protein
MPVATMGRFERILGVPFLRRRVAMAILSAVGGASLLAVGSNFIIPVGSAIGGVCDLAGIVSMMMFFGLIDGE